MGTSSNDTVPPIQAPSPGHAYGISSSVTFDSNAILSVPNNPRQQLYPDAQTPGCIFRGSCGGKPTPVPRFAQDAVGSQKKSRRFVNTKSLFTEKPQSVQPRP